MRRFSVANSDASKPHHGSKHSRGYQAGSAQLVSATAKSSRRYQNAVDDEAAVRVQSQAAQQQDNGEKFEVVVSSMQGDENEPDKPVQSSKMDFNDTDYLDRSVDLGTMLKPRIDEVNDPAEEGMAELRGSDQENPVHDTMGDTAYMSREAPQSKFIS